MYALIVGQDREVSTWLWQAHNLNPMLFDAAFGVVNDEGKLVGACLFTNYNGYNLEFNYYGVNTLSLGLIKTFAAIALEQFAVSRVSILIRKKSKHLMRMLPKFGFKLEGTQRRYYGEADCNRNTAVRFVIFREGLEKIINSAKMSEQVNVGNTAAAST